MTRVRLVEPTDIASIAIWTTDTFDWGDYVAENLSYWLEEDRSAIPAVVDESDAVIALARVRMVGSREGWISAARVRPEHRRQGLASVVNDWCVDWIGQQGGAVARLQIETWNEPARTQVGGLGFRPVADAVNARRSLGHSPMQPATNGGKRPRPEERLQRSAKAEAEAAYIAWSTSELSKASHGLVAVDPWAWKRLTPADVSGGTLWECASGWAIIDDHPEDGMKVRWLVCGQDEAGRLLAAVLDLARNRQTPHLNIALPRVDWLMSPLADRGFDFFESSIYEKVVSAR